MPATLKLLIANPPLLTTTTTTFLKEGEAGDPTPTSASTVTDWPLYASNPVPVIEYKFGLAGLRVTVMFGDPAGGVNISDTAEVDALPNGLIAVI